MTPVSKVNTSIPATNYYLEVPNSTKLIKTIIPNPEDRFGLGKHNIYQETWKGKDNWINRFWNAVHYRVNQGLNGVKPNSNKATQKFTLISVKNEQEGQEVIAKITKPNLYQHFLNFLERKSTNERSLQAHYISLKDEEGHDTPQVLFVATDKFGEDPEPIRFGEEGTVDPFRTADYTALTLSAIKLNEIDDPDVLKAFIFKSIEKINANSANTEDANIVKIHNPEDDLRQFYVTANQPGCYDGIDLSEHMKRYINEQTDLDFLKETMCHLLQQKLKQQEASSGATEF